MKNIVRDLKTQANNAWMVHFNKCSEQGVWKILDPSIHDLDILGRSWRLRWLERKLDEYIQDLKQD